MRSRFRPGAWLVGLPDDQPPTSRRRRHGFSPPLATQSESAIDGDEGLHEPTPEVGPETLAFAPGATRSAMDEAFAILVAHRQECKPGRGSERGGQSASGGCRPQRVPSRGVTDHGGVDHPLTSFRRVSGHAGSRLAAHSPSRRSHFPLAGGAGAACPLPWGLDTEFLTRSNRLCDARRKL